jgi:hypothetical protein
MARLLAAIAAITVAMSVTLSLGGQALAHETRMVGPYRFVVGWLNEPAFQGFANGASVRITDPRLNPAKAMEGLAEAITIEVRSGGLSTTFTGKTRAVFGQPGLYSLDVIPTAGGAYTFQIKGKIETLEFNEKFESGPGRFNDVAAQNALQYPAKAPVAADLAERLDAIDRQLGSLQVIAIVAIVLAIVLPIGSAVMARRRT